MYRSIVFCALLAVSVRCEKAKEEPLNFRSAVDKMNATLQNVTSILEDILGVNIPSTQEEVKTALQENLNGLKQNAEKFQKKLDEYNVTGVAKGILQQAQAQIDTAVKDLTKDNPNLQAAVENAKKGYASIADVTQQVGTVIQEHATAASGDLKSFGEQAQVELSKAAKQLESQFQQVLADKQKKSKTG